LAGGYREAASGPFKDHVQGLPVEVATVAIHPHDTAALPNVFEGVLLKQDQVGQLARFHRAE
jgi:hypothetical protein